MPIARFQLPDGRIARFEVPEGLTPEEAEQLVAPELFQLTQPAPKPKEPTVLGQVGEAFKGLVPGAVGLLETGVTGAAALLPEETEQAVRAKTKELAEMARKPFAAEAGYEQTVGRKLGEAIGSTIPFLAAGPFGLAGRIGAVGMGVAAGAGEARQRAEAEQATGEDRALATALGIGPGALEAFAPLRILGRLGDDIVGGGVAYVKRALVAGGEEAAQEAASNFAQNLIAKGIYKPEQELIEGLGEQAAYGGATGAIIQGLMDLALGRRARGAGQPPAPVTPVTPETEVTPVPPVTPTAAVTPEVTPEVPAAPVEPTPAPPTAAAPEAAELAAEPPAAEAPAFALPVRNQNQQRLVENIMSNYGMTPEQVQGFIDTGRIKLGKDGMMTAQSVEQLRVVGQIDQGTADLKKALAPSPTETKPLEQPPLPKAPEIIEMETEVARLAKDIKRLETTDRGPTLMSVLRNRLSAEEINNISPDKDIARLFGKSAKKGKGEQIADIIANNELDDFLSPDLIIQPDDPPSVQMDKALAGEELIREKIRNNELLSFETDTKLQQLRTYMRQIEDEIGLEADRASANAMVAEVAAEEGLSPVSEVAAPELLAANKKINQPLYHGTNVKYDTFDFDASGGLTFFGENFDIGSRYAYGGGGQRQRLDNNQKYIVDSSSGVVYEQGPNNEWVAVGLSPQEGLITSENLDPLDKSYPPLSQQEAEKITDPWSGSASVIPKQARVVETSFKDLNLLDITTPEGRDVFASLKPSSSIIRSLIEAAKMDQRSAYNDAVQLNTNFWGLTKRSQAFKKDIREGIVEPLKKLGYDGIYFNDDQHKTAGLFDSPKVIKQLGQTEFQLTGETEAERRTREATAEQDIAAREAKAIADRERELFTLVPETAEREMPATGDMFGARGLTEQPAAPSAPAVEPPTLAEQKEQALQYLPTALSNVIPNFRAQHPNGRVYVTKPRPLSAKQKNELTNLAKDAIELGLPPSLIYKIKSGGMTGMDNTASMAASDGWIMLGKKWASSTNPEKLQTFAHELGHVVDYKSNDERYSISQSSAWAPAHQELKAWYDREPNIQNPLAYPFSPAFKKAIPDTRTESFPQAFGLYFTAPVQLQTNAPTAYSEIQSIVERINNESATAAGAPAAATTGVEVRQGRIEPSAKVQPQVSEVGADVGRAKRVKAPALEQKRIEQSIVSQNILGNALPVPTWGRPDDRKMDDALYVLQDKYIDLKRVQQAIEQAGRQIDQRWNPYLKEELYHGRTAKQTKDFLQEELRPLLQQMQASNVDMATLEEYLHNRHAEERNKQIASINPNMQDGGSGIMTADARSYLAKLSPAERTKLEALAQLVDAITKGTRQILVDSGLETQNTIDTWEKTYGKYVPLNREESDYDMFTMSSGTGQGFATRGPASKRALGSERKVIDILANIAAQRERTIVRAEKGRVGQALYGLVVSNPNPNFWLAVDPQAMKDPATAAAELVAMGLNPLDIQNIIKEPVISDLDPKTKEVILRTNLAFRNSDFVYPVRINGMDRFVYFNPKDPRAKRMVEAIKNLDADQMARGLSMVGRITRYFAAINTQYNPIFGIVNFGRDVQGAMIQISTTPIADKRKQIIRDSGPALQGIWADLRARRSGEDAPTGEWSQLWEAFQRAGGQTGFRDQFSRSEERAEALADELKQLSEGKIKAGGRAIFNWLSDYNETLENAIRLSAFKAALESNRSVSLNSLIQANQQAGLAKDQATSKAIQDLINGVGATKNSISAEQAASIAKNLTVNFNRKGQIAQYTSALYAFFNASVQGTKRMLDTIVKVENNKVRLTTAGKTVVYGGLVLGSLQAMLLAAAGFEDDQPPEFVKEKNLVIPLFDGKKYISIPMPLGFNVIPSTSRILTEWGLSGFKNTPKRVAQFTGLFLDAFNPIGNAGWSFQTFAPTIADPAVALFENRDWTGKPIAKEDISSLDPTPGYTRAKDSASSFSTVIAQLLNYVSGGTKYAPGIISPTPDQLDYLIGQATGGVGRELLKVEKTATGLVTGEETPSYSIPLAGRFYGNASEAASVRDKFFDNIRKLNIHQNEIGGRRRDKESVTEYLLDNPEARLYRQADAIERDIRQLRKRKEALKERGASREEIKRIDDLMVLRMQRLNDRVKELQR